MSTTHHSVKEPALSHPLKRLCARTSLAMAFLHFVSPAEAATIVVDTTADGEVYDALCSLREAIKAANQDTAYLGCTPGSGADTIWLASSATHHMTLPQPLEITSEVRIDSNQVWLWGTPESGGFRVHDTGILTLLWTNMGGFGLREAPTLFVHGGQAHLRSVQIQANGDPTTILSQSAGVWNQGGYVTIHDSTLAGNQGIKGGGIYNTSSGYVYAENTTISFNSSIQFGGGVATEASAYTYLHNCTVSGNRAVGGDISSIGNGGGISNRLAGTTWVTNSTIVNNTAGISGGGLFNGPGSVLNIFGSIVDNNTSNRETVQKICDGTISSWGRNLFNGTFWCRDIVAESSEPDLLDQASQLEPLTQYEAWQPAVHKPLSTSPVINFIPANSCWGSYDQVFNSRPTGSGCDIGSIEYTP